MAILVGRNKSNRFRQAMLELASMPGDIFILSTGYIEEEIFYDKHGNYDKGLTDAILNSLPSGGSLYLIGGRFWEHNTNECKQPQTHVTVFKKWTFDCYMCEFRHFSKLLEIECKSKGKNGYVLHDSNWHAKMALKLRRSGTELKVVGALVGSSNLTSRAFSASHTYPTTECDIFMWDRRYLARKNVPITFDILDPLNIERYRDGFIDVLPVKLTAGLSEKVVFDSLLSEVEPFMRRASKVT